MIDNALAYFTLQLSRLVTKTHYEKVRHCSIDISTSMLMSAQEMQRLQMCIDEINKSLYNPMGLNILWPHKVAFMFVSVSLLYFVVSARSHSPHLISSK